MIQQIEPAGADRKDWDKVEQLFQHPRWSLERKLDGWRFLLHVGKGLPRAFLTGRRISKKTGQYSEKGECAPHLLPTGAQGRFLDKLKYTVIDGEVMPPDGATFRDLAGIMNVDPDKAHARIEEIGYPEYHAFDLLFFNGRDVRNKPQSWRYSTLHELILTAWADHPHVFGVKGYLVDKLGRYDKWIAEGGEGGILKDPDAPYGRGWIKVKRYSTLDVIITGFTEANEGKTGKYKGQIGAAIVSVYGDNGELIEVGQVSGMNDAMRLRMTKKPERWIGNVIEVAAQEMAKDRLRHPRFKRPRFDADPRHATMQKLQADLTVAQKETDEEE